MTYVPMPVLRDGGRSFEDGIARVLRWMDTFFPALRANLNSPADNAVIDAAQASCCVVFPDDLRALYRVADGETGVLGFFFGLPFLSLSRLVDEWSAWRDVAQDVTEMDKNSDGFYTSVPPDVIAGRYTNPGWIAISHDHGGNHLGVDLAPGPCGRVGQVINFGADEDEKFVIAPSLAAFFHWYADNLECGNYKISGLPGDEDFDFTIADPANEHFLDAVREMGQL